jgi:hypothetical protein
MLRWQPQRMPTHTRASLESNSRLTPTLSRARTLTCANVATRGLTRATSETLTLHFGPAEVPGVGLVGSLSLHISWQRGRKEFMSCIVFTRNTENSPAEFVLADRRLGSTVGPDVDAKIGVTLRRRGLKIQNRIGCPHTVFPTPLTDTTTRIFRLCLASCRLVTMPRE